MNKLIERRNKLAREIRNIDDKLEEERETKLLPAAIKKYTGKCYLSRNSYGGEKWDLFRKVVSVETIYANNNISARTIDVQTDCDGKTTIEDGYGYTESMGNEIKESVFSEALEKAINKIRNTADV